MKEISLHVYDLLENSISADATLIELTVHDSLVDNIYHFCIKDNGKGMNKDFLVRAYDPWTTTRKTRKLGMGLPLIKMRSEGAGGGTKLESELGKGTTLKFWFQHNHLDRPPIGDIAGTIAMLCFHHKDIRFVYRHITDTNEFIFNTDEIKDVISDMSIHGISIIRYLKNMIQEKLLEINYNE